jgi:hypothetical protein
VEFHGNVSSAEILALEHPSRAAQRGLKKRDGYAYLSDAEGTATVPGASSGRLVAWSLLRLAPWLLAAAVLALLVPILRAADRGDPFGSGAPRRLGVVGSVLLVGIPALAVLDYLFAQAVNTQGFAPMVNPALSIGVLHFLPGALLLALAGIFRTGGELRDLDRHTV